MDYSLLVWLLPTIALVVGVIVGFFVARALPNAVPNGTQRQLDDVQERFDKYQNEVITHFNSTANLVQKLSQSYHDVQEHLAEGANRLATDDITRQRLLAALHPDALQPPRDRLTPPRTAAEPPKDYAPKSADSPGMLDEHYGLKK
ncbi:YhcB family protein [Pseudomonas sp.]|uniref:YhcB family protein n=1 Tax=Pseudomonas sp. TaxID=306 RepID=UPI002EDA494C